MTALRQLCDSSVTNLKQLCDGYVMTDLIALISFGHRNDWTKTTHMRAIDVWVILCYIGIFSALLEYCFVLYLTNSSLLDSKFGRPKPKEINPVNEEESNLNHESKEAAPIEINLEYARKIENVSRIIIVIYNATFPLFYFVICIAFS